MSDVEVTGVRPWQRLGVAPHEVPGTTPALRRTRRNVLAITPGAQQLALVLAWWRLAGFLPWMAQPAGGEDGEEEDQLLEEAARRLGPERVHVWQALGVHRCAVPGTGPNLCTQRHLALSTEPAAAQAQLAAWWTSHGFPLRASPLLTLSSSSEGKCGTGKDEKLEREPSLAKLIPVLAAQWRRGRSFLAYPPSRVPVVRRGEAELARLAVKRQNLEAGELARQAADAIKLGARKPLTLIATPSSSSSSLFPSSFSSSSLLSCSSSFSSSSCSSSSASSSSSTAPSSQSSAPIETNEFDMEL